MQVAGPPAVWRRRLLWGLALVAALVVSRAPLTPRYFITFDSVNFALSVDQFNPGLHQPQPPGYPLFVLALKLLSTVVPPGETMFFTAGVLFSLGALLLLWTLGDRLLGPGRGIIAALLLLFNPAFWLSPLTNPVRLGYAVGAPAVALCLCLALERGSRRWFLMAVAALGIASGLRPDLSIILAPVVLWTAFRLRLGWRTLAGALLVYACCLATWVPVLVAATGGWRSYYRVLQEYAYMQTQASSPLMGARLSAAVNMAWQAVVWSCLGTLSWIWAVPWTLGRKRAMHHGNVPVRRLLAWWFVPGLLFYALYHVGDPDHTLSIIPVTCLVGAAVLTAFTQRFSARARSAVILAAVLLNVFLFFKPVAKAAVPSTYKPVRWLDHYMSGMIDTIAGLQEQGGVTVIVFEPVAGWRAISYYAPESRVLVIRGYASGPAGWGIHQHRPRDWPVVEGAFRVPACGWLAWVDPDFRPARIRGSSSVFYRAHPVSFTHAAAGDIFQFRGHQFVATSDGCPVQP